MIRRALALVCGVLAFGPGSVRAQEVLVEADASEHPPDHAGKTVHGDIRLGAAVGFITEDPIVGLAPSLGLDFSDLAPVELRLGAPVHLRIYDRNPEQGPVVRKTEWDEAGDYLSILQQLSYNGDYIFGVSGRATVDVRVGGLGRVNVGHGTVVRGYANSLDVDRRRTGVDALARVEGDLLDMPAGSEIQIVIGDLAGQQIFGTRLGADWAGAGLGFSVVGDPFAPHLLNFTGQGLEIDKRNQLVGTGRGVAVLGFDLSYNVSDRWRYLIVPYFDMNFIPGLGRGMHLGVDSEFRLGRRRAFRIGVVAELTVGSSHYDPVFFDVFYSTQRMQAQLAGRKLEVGDPFYDTAQPKAQFALQNDFSGAGGYAGLRLAHDEGFFFETGYRYRPGPLGHTWETRLGLDLEVVQMSLLAAHRGALGFNIAERAPNGTLARLDLAVPVHRFIDVTLQAGWQPVMRRAVNETAAHGVPSSGFYGAGALLLFGAAGHFDW